jgi:hypothetical protein
MPNPTTLAAASVTALSPYHFLEAAKGAASKIREDAVGGVGGYAVEGLCCCMPTTSATRC